MLYSYSEAITIFKNDYNLKKAISAGQFSMIEKGIYSDGGFINYSDLEIVMKKYSSAFLAKESALHFIGILKSKPEKIHLGTARNALRIKDERVVQHLYTGFNKEELSYSGYGSGCILNKNNLLHYYTEKGTEIRVLNIQALVFDLIRDRNKFSPSEFEALLAGVAKLPVSYDFDTFVLEDAFFEAHICPDKKTWELLRAIEDNAWDNKLEKERSEMWD